MSGNIRSMLAAGIGAFAVSYIPIPRSYGSFEFESTPACVSANINKNKGEWLGTASRDTRDWDTRIYHITQKIDFSKKSEDLDLGRFVIVKYILFWYEYCTVEEITHA